MPQTATADLALAGVRVVDFSRLLPEPWCTQTLGDLGADVIKVEQPEIGDFVLDLAAEGDRAVAEELTARADIIVESFRPGVTEKLGIDYAGLTDPERRPSPQLGEHGDEVRRELDGTRATRAARRSAEG